jgi:hypothetical protein
LRVDEAGVLNPDLPPGEYVVSKVSIPLASPIESSLRDLSSNDLCLSMFNFGLSRRRERSKSSISDIEHTELTFLSPPISLVPSICFSLSILEYYRESFVSITKCKTRITALEYRHSTVRQTNKLSNTHTNIINMKVRTRNRNLESSK